MCSALFDFVIKHACDRQTEGQSDGGTYGQNYDSQDSASIVASRGKIYDIILKSLR